MPGADPTERATMRAAREDDPAWLAGRGGPALAGDSPQVLASRADASRPTQDLVLAEIAARLDAEHGAGAAISAAEERR
jgi:hypothetical protein